MMLLVFNIGPRRIGSPKMIVLKMEQFDFTKQHMYYWEKIQAKMASSANPAQTAPLGAV